MDKYTKLWELAKPYYKKGRIYDIPHIEWMMSQAEELLKLEQNLNKEILLPVVILHDVGYSEVGQLNPNVKDPNTKKIHMEKGAEISERLLRKLNFSEKIIKEVSYLISVHDNWVLGDNEVFKKIPEMAAFNDLDFIYPFSTLEQFKRNAESMGIGAEEALNLWSNDEKLKNRPLCTEYTKELFDDLREEIKEQLLN